MIHHWVEYGDAVPPEIGTLSEDNLRTARVFWLNGPGSAGTGKSTIAYTVAQDLDQRQKLGASFFCSRDNADCSNPKLIFPTIAYQLGQFYSPLQDEISAVLKADPDVAYSVVSRQLEWLLVKPLWAVKGQMPFCVVVIDALDECQDGGATSMILSSLAQYVTALSPLKFLITSRPEVRIIEGFKLERLSLSTQRCILHHVEQKVVETDLLLFLHSSLQKTKRMYSLDVTWPSMTEIQALVHLSSGLFIFAATAARFIQDRHHSNPQGQLAQLLGAITAKTSSSHEILDQLYLQVLENAFPNIPDAFACRLKLVLGSVALLYDSLTPSDLEQLLHKPVQVNDMLQHLQSVLVLPNGSNDTMHLIHPSFHDFLVDPRRCSNVKFQVTPELQHSLLAQACLHAMKLLKRNICNIDQPWEHHHELGNLLKVAHQHIPQFLQYACQHWWQHLVHGLLSDELLNMLEEFCHNYLLYWVEACSLMGNLRSALFASIAVHNLLVVCYFCFVQFCYTD